MPQLTIRNVAARVRELPSSVEEPEQSKSSPSLSIGSRWEPCLHLSQVGVPYTIWTNEDVFKFHGLYRYRGAFRNPHDFQYLDIGLLVNDMEEAATVLEGAGYFRTGQVSAERKRMGYRSGNGWSFIRLLNASAMVQEYSQWETVEQVIARIAHAAGVKRISC